jgi:drug/metabolite transporter (DMT)-like permease
MVEKMSPALTVTYVMALGWLAILPLFLISGGWMELSRLSAVGWSGVLFLGLLCSGAAYIFWYDALDTAGASQVATFLYIEPLVTLIVATRLIGEKITWASLVGGGIILLGVWLVNRPAGVEREAASVERRTSPSSS